MKRGSRIGIVAILLLAGIVIGSWLSGVFKTKSLVLRGAVLTNDPDPRQQLPVADARIAIRLSSAVPPSDLSRLFSLENTGPAPLAEAKSDNRGYFTLTLPRDIRRGRSVTFEVTHSAYQSLAVNDHVGDQLYVLRMEVLRRGMAPQPAGPPVTIGNVLVRYSVKSVTPASVGSAARTFEVVNTGNVPCNGRNPCSPDGKWKASIGSISLDAGPGNMFHNARASCIAGPCSFTRIDDRELYVGGPKISVSARNWSDTAVFLVEAEVVHPMISDVVRESHPYVLGRALNFTVPASAEGITLQAELNGETIVFPLGPALILDWADCTAQMDAQRNQAYRCELKPGYRFGRSS
ncbi:MAG: carboxypeptidase regulatory-like domain-containing protein [Acidobacteria bacterium]|nr:carboxypeptidase regulatory-like domain-containing protein [Acidobacteriota bacterium]